MIAWVVLAYHRSEPARVLPRGFYCQEEAEAYAREIDQHCAASLQTVWNLPGVGLDWSVRWSNFEPSADRRPTPQMPMADALAFLGPRIQPRSVHTVRLDVSAQLALDSMWLPYTLYQAFEVRLP